MADFKPEPRAAAEQILKELRQVGGILRGKATAEETQGFLEWMMEVAQVAAGAAKEGGFLGFRAVRVSEGEQRMLEQLRGALGFPRGGRCEY